MQQYLYIDFNSYFASVEQELNPAIRGKPVAVVPVMSDSTCAIAASYEAKAYGIRTGTRIWEAKKMCRELICVPAMHENYVSFHARILEEIERHIPVEMVCSIDEMACRLMKNEREKAVGLALEIKAGLAKNVGEYVRCSIGIASNRYLAKVATDLQKPDGLTILSPEDIPNRLFALKLRDLPGIGYSMEARLNRAGISSIRQLWELKPKQMRQLWHSVWGEKMYHLLRGEDLPNLETHRSTVGHSHVMAPEFREPQKARQIARRLTIKAASRLRRLGYYACAFVLSARIENGHRWAGEIRCYRAQDNFTFLEMLDVLWQEMVGEIGTKRLKKVSVTLHHLVAADQIQPELFDLVNNREQGLKDDKRRRYEKISAAMDMINHKYGRDSILLGTMPPKNNNFTGVKVAFTRIPEVEEFFE